MTADKTWSFTTASVPDTTPPTVTSPVPTSGATGVAADTLVTGTFTERVQGSTVGTSTFTLKAGLTGISRSSHTRGWRYGLLLTPHHRLLALLNGYTQLTITGGSSGVKTQQVTYDC